MEKPTLPKGTRDFGPAAMGKRQFIFDTIRSAFNKFGFLPLETPASENASALTGKYGEEGDQLLFRILNSGDYLEEFRKTMTLSATHLKELFTLTSKELDGKLKPQEQIESIIESVSDTISFSNQEQRRFLSDQIRKNKRIF